ncbi:MAG TPA: thioredoxin domain-containing protein [Gemmatimonadaceae bacterium]|nr:thioredoxin domain-containing protein [Gemmatimonadaceae bacterium]
MLGTARSLLIVAVAATSACARSSTTTAASAVAVHLPVAGVYGGSDTASVVLVEFGSFACGVCRQFSQSVFPGLDSTYVARGRLRYRYVDLSPEGVFAYRGALSQCLAETEGVSRAKRFVFDSLGGATEARPTLARAALHSGITPEVLARCIEAAQTDPRRKQERDAAERLGVRGTPTFIVGHIDGRGRLVGWPYIGLDRPDSLVRLVDAASRVLAAPRRGPVARWLAGIT